MTSLILNFFLLILEISLDFSLDAGYKSREFSKSLLEKNLKFIPIGRKSTIIFNLGLVFLPVEIDFISKKQGCKRNVLEAHNTSYVKRVFASLTVVIVLYKQATIVYVRVLGLKNYITEGIICFTIFLALNKQF